MSETAPNVARRSPPRQPREARRFSGRVRDVSSSSELRDRDVDASSTSLAGRFSPADSLVASSASVTSTAWSSAAACMGGGSSCNVSASSA
ncbi:hypothetical protein [Isoptericola rhizosphaerae]|uniref:hypothetical protein n=1 Tax=Isoptericola rhizosphaerae TaxID=3377837 RepID=UPI003839CFCC